MVGMKGDMGGAAAVAAAVSVARDVGVKVRVRAFLPLTDNMLGGDAQRIGDVIRYRNGTTVEVLNTDAEGRLILADGLVAASEENPAAIVDVATLTGAAVVALGSKVAAVLGNNESFTAQVQAAAEAAGEPMWPLPLYGDYRARPRVEDRGSQERRRPSRRHDRRRAVPAAVRRRRHPVGPPRHRRSRVWGQRRR